MPLLFAGVPCTVADFVQQASVKCPQRPKSWAAVQQKTGEAEKSEPVSCPFASDTETMVFHKTAEWCLKAEEIYLFQIKFT